MEKKYMMATKALHKLGDISSDTPDLCFIHSEDEKNYIGEWVTGFGFVNVNFPKETTKELTEEDIEKFSGTYSLSGMRYQITKEELKGDS